MDAMLGFLGGSAMVQQREISNGLGKVLSAMKRHGSLAAETQPWIRLPSYARNMKKWARPSLSPKPVLKGVANNSEKRRPFHLSSSIHEVLMNGFLGNGCPLLSHYRKRHGGKQLAREVEMAL